jgi:hypothetical protein
MEDSVSGFDESAIREIILSSGGNYLEIPPEDYFSYDGSHLSSASARKLSEVLGHELISIPD